MNGWILLALVVVGYLSYRMGRHSTARDFRRRP